MSSLKLINTQTVSGVALVNFTSGIDSTYDVYNVKFFNVTPVSDNVDLQVNWTNDGGSILGGSKRLSLCLWILPGLGMAVGISHIARFRIIPARYFENTTPPAPGFRIMGMGFS